MFILEEAMLILRVLVYTQICLQFGVAKIKDDNVVDLVFEISQHINMQLLFQILLMI